LPLQSDSLGLLSAALCGAQAEFKPISRDASAQIREGRSYRYSTLDAVYDAIRPTLAKHGLSISHMVECDGERHYLRTVLRHTSDQYQASRMALLCDMRRPHDVGSNLTYWQRYQACGLAGVAPEADDDGARAMEAAASAPRRERPAPQFRPRYRTADEARAAMARQRDDDELAAQDAAFDEFAERLAKPKPQPKAVAPTTGRELYDYLVNKLKNPGPVLAWVVETFEARGYPHRIVDWKPEHVSSALPEVGKFIRDLNAGPIHAAEPPTNGNGVA
jgi:hypothetical protein